MRPRIILRTHYQADEPRTIIAVITDCSSPTDSRNEQAVADGLVRWAKENGHVLSIPGAVYAVGNARSLGLINNFYRWTAKGMAFAYAHSLLGVVPGNGGLVLRAPEERLYLRYYIEAGGALLVKFGRWLLDHGRASEEELRTESVIEKLVLEILDEYLSITTEIRDRTAIRRERERLSQSNYASSTKRHKRYPLVKTMERLNLAVVENKEGHRLSVAPDPAGKLRLILQAIPDIRALEQYCKNGRVQEVIDQAEYGMKVESSQPPGIGPLVAGAYEFAMGRGLQACPLDYLEDVLFAFVKREPHDSSQRITAEHLFDSLRLRFPNEVRFHVDRQGRRAFVLVSGNASAGLSELLWPMVV